MWSEATPCGGKKVHTELKRHRKRVHDSFLKTDIRHGIGQEDKHTTVPSNGLPRCRSIVATVGKQERSELITDTAVT